MRPRQTPEWQLGQIAEYLRLANAGNRSKITGISLDTSTVCPGDLFAALPGAREHGARFIAQARQAGAIAALTDPQGASMIGDQLPVLVHPQPRTVLPGLAAHFYRCPADSFNTVGITGTQGKTTATYLAEAAVGATDSAVIGTIGTRIKQVPAASALTTPDAAALQALFAVMREEQIGTCAMEVSSHALVQGRVDSLVFDVAAFLNLGRDHLDYHNSVEDYFLAKAKLFTAEHARSAVINIDDPFGRRLAGMTTLPVTTFSVGDPAADWYGTDTRVEQNGSRLTLHGPGGVDVALRIQLPATFNVSNAIAVIAALTAVGHDPHECAEGIAGVAGVPGRLERIDRGQTFAAYVDFAHKPDAVTAVLSALRPLTRGRLIIVLGAGGDRDPGKRPLMGQAAHEHADLVVVTDDNPRHEDPADIRAAVIGGYRGVKDLVEVPGRREAIAYAVRTADAGDTVLIAGKGHETGQQIADDVHHFDDRQELGAAIEATA